MNDPHDGEDIILSELPDDELVLARENGTLQRNFQGYSTHRQCDLVALGVSGIGGIGSD